MFGSGWGRVQVLGAGAALSFVLALTGCGAFFQCEGKADCGTGSGGGSAAGTGDYVYTTNASSSLNAIAGYSISSTGTLAALPGSPYTVTPQPTALVVGIGNKYLYAASINTTNPGIYIYSISSTGALSTANGGAPVSDGYPIYAMTVSADGNWLYTVEFNSLQYVIGQYQLVSGIPQTPTLPLMQSSANCSLTTANCSIAVSPSGNFLIAVAGSAGAILYPYSSSSSGGITSTANPQGISSTDATNGDFSVVVDSSNYAYISKRTSIESYLISSSGVPQSSNSLTTTNFINGEVPHSILVSNGYVFTANQGNSTISSFSASNGVLTSVGGEVAGPSSVYSIAVDNTGNYLVAAGSGSSGLGLYSISSSGVLSNLNQNFATSTTSIYPIVVATTH